MIQFKNFRQYTHMVDSIRFPQNPKEPFVLIYFSENSNFIEDYNKLNLKRIDFRNVLVPMTSVPRTRLTPELVRLYKSLKLIPQPINQKPPVGRNIIIDISQYTNAIDNMYKPISYRQRAGFLIKNILNSVVNLFPDNYQKVFFYSVDLNKNVNKFVNTKIFPILQDMKKDDFKFNHMILNTITEGSVRNRLLVKDDEYAFPRVLTYIRRLKGVQTDEEQEKEVATAANIVIKSVEKNIDPKHKDQIKSAIEDYLEKEPDEAVKVSSGEATADDIKSITTASILFKASGDFTRSKLMARNIPSKQKTAAMKAIDKSLADEIIKPEKTISLTTDPRVAVYNPAKAVGGKSPNHVYKKRQLDFSTNLKKDFVNSFKVLETKDVPLKMESMSFRDKSSRKGELMKSDLAIMDVTLKDGFGNTHKISLEIPLIDPTSGVFRINGRRKCLVNQIVQNPITFPAPGESRFESSYSVFRIYVKKLRNVKYLETFMSYKLPLFFLLAFSFGFNETCRMYKIKYNIVDKKPTGEEFYAKIKSGQYVVFSNVTTDLQKYLCASLIHGNLSQYDIPKEFPSKEYFESVIIKLTGKINSTYLISSNLQNIVDPVVKQVLKNKQLPIDLDLIMKYMAGKVVDGYYIARNDLSNQRIRNSEVLVHLAQKQILAAYTVYKEQLLSGNTEAQFEINQTKVLSDFLNTELVVDMEYANPIEEMATMTRVSPSGKKVGGIPDKRAIQTGSRNLHPSYFGNIDPLDTSESDNIGIVQQLTIDALISSSRGLFSTKEITDKEGTGMLSTTTCMIPFLENTDGARVIMLANQAKQMLPLKGPQPPIVQSGYESILTGVLSDNFVKKAPCKGKILNITIDEITLQCGNKKENVDISPVHLRSGSGKNTLSVFNVIVQKGQSVNEGEVIAEGACMSNGSISLGRPLLAALMPYRGYNFEDGVVISESVASEDKLTSLHGVEDEVLVSEQDRVLYIAKIGDEIPKGQPLLRKTLGEIEDIIGFEDDESTDMYAGQYIKKSPGGRIVDIEIYSNINENKFPELKEMIQRTNRKNPKPPKEKFTVKYESIKGILIKFKMEQELKVGLGDKLCNRYGNKGIISLVEKDELMPRLPNGDRVDIVLNPIGLIARMNMGQLYEMYCGMIARELGKRMPTLSRAKAIELVSNVYGELDASKNRTTSSMLRGNLSRLSATNYQKLIDNVNKTGFYPIIIPPFQAPKAQQIQRAMKLVDVQPSYTLTLPYYNNVKTARPVPVGYQYIAKLEHMADSKIYGRSTGPVTGKTGQPTSGKRREGGQRMGELDTYSFISYNCPAVLAEFMGPLSDDFVTKEEILAEIVQTGRAKYREPKISPARDLLNAYFTSLMLARN
jgi:DNA-directed RNA polymerase beta subunit